MAFDAQIIHWPTLSDFTAHLATVPHPSWCVSATAHNTYIPNEAQWRGLTSMNSMIKTYIAKGWSAGPHLYLVAECPNPNDRGIWQMTPLAHVGVHAGPCNSDRLGVENVADWEARPPTSAQYGLLLDVLEAIWRAWGLTVPVNVHNECMTGRTCPGQYLHADQLRVDLAARLALRTYRMPTALDIFQRSDLVGPTAGQIRPGETVQIDAQWPLPGYAPTAGHLADGRGFVDLTKLEAL